MDEERLKELYSDKVGKKVILRKKTHPDYDIVGVLDSIVGTKLIVKGKHDEYHVDFDNLANIDVKGKESSRRNENE